MNFTWKLPIQPAIGMATPLAERKVARVLLEYEGPQLAILEAGQRKFLALAADEDERCVRWIHAPVSNLELKALLRGQIAIRDVIAKSEIAVLDVSLSGVLGMAWPSAPLSAVPAECLPDVDAMLPEFARDKLAPRAERIAFQCEGESVRGHSIMFSCLAALAGSLQRFWSAIAPESGVNVQSDGEWGGATLACAAGKPGSFSIEVEPHDKAAFEAIASAYKTLVRESYGDPRGVQAKLEKRRPSLAQAYAGYLHALETFKVDVLFDEGTDAAFLGFDHAARIRPYVARSGVRNPSEGQRIEIVSATGYFDGFAKLKATFEFFDIATGLEYKGSVTEAVLRYAQGQDIIIGRHAPKYTVQIQVAFGPGRKRKCSLLAVKELSPEGPGAPPVGS